MPRSAAVEGDGDDVCMDIMVDPDRGHLRHYGRLCAVNQSHIIVALRMDTEQGMAAVRLAGRPADRVSGSALLLVLPRLPASMKVDPAVFAGLSKTDQLAINLRDPDNRALAHQVLFRHRHPDATPAFHDEIINLWHSDHHRCLVMAFREAGKSTIAEEAFVLGAA